MQGGGLRQAAHSALQGESSDRVWPTTYRIATIQWSIFNLYRSKEHAMEDLVIEEEGTSSALKITLGDFLVFINWMNQTERALERGEALPTAPGLDTGKVTGWIRLVQRLEERYRRSEEKKLALEANVIAQEAQ